MGAGEFLVNTAGFAIPAYYSLEALFTSGKADDTQWLTYWVVYAFFTVIESALNAVYWFPFYYTFKFCFIIWMALPQTAGAQVVFRSLMQPLFARFFEGGSTSANLRSQADKAQNSVWDTKIQNVGVRRRRRQSRTAGLQMLAPPRRLMLAC